jgi:hypothetical protein
MFAALKDLDTEVEMNNAWEIIRENIRISGKEGLDYCQMRKHKLWLDKGCSKLLVCNKQQEKNIRYLYSEINEFRDW